MYELHPIQFTKDTTSSQLYQRTDGGVIRFDTYFNMFSLWKWRCYTTIQDLFLRWVIRGSCRLVVYALDEHNQETEILRHDVRTGEGTFQVIPVPYPDSARMLFLQIESDKTIEIEYIAWCTDKPEENDIRLCPAICTFKREEFVYRNMDMFRLLFEQYPEYKEKIHIFISDNGQSLDCDRIHCPNVRIFSNQNTGGSGGFARASIEILRSEIHATHVLIMDDDIELSPLCLVLTVNLLRYLKPEFSCHFIGGMMFNLERRTIKTASLEWMTRKRMWTKTAEQDMSSRENVLDADINSTHPDQYQSWWYCVIPTTVINLQNLPVPVFFKTDDIEFSVRNKAKIILMNGISVWHEPFYKKLTNHLPYYIFRNALFMSSVHSLFDEQTIIKRIGANFRFELRQFNYSGARVYIDVLKDFLKGPEVLESASRCLHILRRELLRNEKRLPLEDVEMLADFSEKKLSSGHALKGVKKAVYKITINGLMLPDWMRNSTSAVAKHSGDQSTSYYFRNSVFSINPMDRTVVERRFNKIKGKRLLAKFTKLLKQYHQQKDAIKSRFAEKFRYLTSIDFYRDYLHLD